MTFSVRRAAAVAACVAFAGCASLPPERGYAETNALIESRSGVAPNIEAVHEGRARTSEIPGDPLSVERAVRIAFVNNPRIREEYARLGLGRAELEEARRIANPTIGYSRLNAQTGDGSKVTRSLALTISDLLLLPARKRFAVGELERLQNVVAAALLELANEVEVAWFESVGAHQVAAMRDLVANAAEQSSALAQRFFDAGNITRLQFEQELAAAAKARIDAVRAHAEALRARSKLASLLGLPLEAGWTTIEQLPAPLDSAVSADRIVPLALEQRLDLAAARREVALREDALGVTRRWRWLGSAEIGYERESETDGSVLRGPTLSLELPIFNQGQAAIARAQADLMDARARLDALVLSVHNEGRLGLERLAVTRDIAERYRTALVPRREAIVARTQEQVNFMLVGVFELLLAKQQEYDAYQEYLEAVRDYWTARAELRRVVGGRLPDDDATAGATIGVDAILPAAEPVLMDHSKHAAPAHEAPGEAKQPASDPHAGHAMPSSPPRGAADPHAGHSMPETAEPAESTPEHDGHAPKAPEREPQTDDAEHESEHHDHGDTP